jgi:ABC-type multidrug transport system ATPase subunit
MSVRSTQRSVEPTREVVSIPEPKPEEVLAHIQVEDLGVRSRRGWVFRNVSFDLPGGALASIIGPAHSGRSALLLSIAGRMRPSEGGAHVGDVDVIADPAAARRAVGLGLFEGLNDLERDLTVVDHLRQERSLHRGSVDIDALLRAAGLDVDPRTPVEELAPLERTRLGVALALAGSPAAIVVDDVDRDLGTGERLALWHTLNGIARRGTTVLSACIDHQVARVADFVLDLETISSKEN